MTRRMLTLTATLSAALCLMPASLAFAGEDDPVAPPPPPAEQPLPQPVPQVDAQPVPEPAPAPQPAPPVAVPAPAPAPKAKAKPKPIPRTVHERRQSSSSGRSAPVTHTILQAQPVATPTQVSTVPVSGVQAGGGAMAQAPTQAGLLGLGAGLVLVATAGGGLALRRRREDA
jgi:outer membrane biosynthesis protein TonB